MAGWDLPPYCHSHGTGSLGPQSVAPSQHSRSQRSSNSGRLLRILTGSLLAMQRTVLLIVASPRASDWSLALERGVSMSRPLTERTISRAMVVFSVVSTEGNVSVMALFADARKEVWPSARALPAGSSYLGIPFTEWEQHSGRTVRVSAELTLLPIAVS